MSAVLFVGPSLPAAEARAAFGGGPLTLLPPATQGDVLAALALQPRVIGLVDGAFDGRPAVLHKELLHALAGGVHVLGAASMGALRAAELHVFGMIGIGRVFADYRDGVLLDDGEVALVHADAGHGFAPLSEALVDIRATLEAARTAGVIDAAQTHAMLAVARALHYPERQWPTLLAALPTAAAERLRDWLPTGRVQRKRDDAVQLVRAMRELLGSDPAPLEVSWQLQHSHFWEELRERHPLEFERLLEEKVREVRYAGSGHQGRA